MRWAGPEGMREAVLTEPDEGRREGAAGPGLRSALEALPPAAGCTRAEAAVELAEAWETVSEAGDLPAGSILLRWIGLMHMQVGL